MIADSPDSDLKLLCSFLDKESRSILHQSEIRFIGGRYFLKCIKCRSGNLVGILWRKFNTTNQMDIAVAMRDAWRAHVSPAPKYLVDALQEAEDGFVPTSSKKASKDTVPASGRVFRFDL